MSTRAPKLTNQITQLQSKRAQALYPVLEQWLAIYSPSTGLLVYTGLAFEPNSIFGYLTLTLGAQENKFN